MKEKLECGCTHDGRQLTGMCLNHKRESDRRYLILATPEYLALVERGQAMLH